MNLNINLSKLMADNYISLSVLHRNTGVAIPTIKRLQSDPTANPTMTTLLPIANFFNITINQLLGKEPLPKLSSGYIENKDNWVKVPLITWQETIKWADLKREKFEDTVLVDIDIGQSPYALRVEEDDWFFIVKGSILIFNSEIKPEHKDYAIVHKNGYSQPALKQVIYDEENIYLKSMNQYLPLGLFEEEHKFLGVLIQIRKNTKV